MPKMGFKGFNQCAGILGLFFLIGGVSGCKKHTPNEPGGGTSSTPSGESVILVGEVSSMTGSEATFGISTHRGIELALKEINENGGVKGRKLQVITMDDQSKPDEAATAVTKLISQNHVQAILGEVASSRSMAMAAIAQDNKVPMITPSSTNPKVTELGDFIFRVCFIDPFQGEVMAKFAANNLKAKKVAILRDMRSDYSAGLAEFFSAAFKKMGGEVVLEQSYESGDIDFRSQLTSIRAKKPQAILIPGYYTEVGLIARQARELGITVPLLGGDGWDSPKLTEIGGKSVENSYFSNHYSNENKSEVVQNFIAKFKSSYGVAPDGMSAMGYDAALVLADAMKRAPSLQNTEVRNALASTQSFPGATGKITMDVKRNALKSAVVLKVENNSFKFQTTVEP